MCSIFILCRLAIFLFLVLAMDRKNLRYVAANIRQRHVSNELPVPRLRKWKARWVAVGTEPILV